MYGRIERERIQSIQRDEGLAQEQPGDGSFSLVVVTVTAETYPTNANAFYAVKAVDVDGTEQEGETATVTTSGGVFFAYNLGSHVPDEGTYVIAHEAGGRWVFRYDG